MRRTGRIKIILLMIVLFGGVRGLCQGIPKDVEKMLTAKPFLKTSKDLMTNPESIGQYFTRPIYQKLVGNEALGYRYNEGFILSGLNVSKLDVSAIKGLGKYLPMLKRALAMTLIDANVIQKTGQDSLTVKLVGVETGTNGHTPGLVVELVATDVKKSHAFYLRLGTGSTDSLPRAMVNLSVLIAGALKDCQ